jgi:hypothetical protein
MNNKKELKDRIQAKKKELESKLYEARADARAEARQKVESLQGKLDKLNDYLKEGWDNMSEDVAAKLNEWLKND